MQLRATPTLEPKYTLNLSRFIGCFFGHENLRYSGPDAQYNAVTTQLFSIKFRMIKKKMCTIIIGIGQLKTQ